MLHTEYTLHEYCIGDNEVLYGFKPLCRVGILYFLTTYTDDEREPSPSLEICRYRITGMMTNKRLSDSCKEILRLRAFADWIFEDVASLNQSQIPPQATFHARSRSRARTVADTFESANLPLENMMTWHFMRWGFGNCTSRLHKPTEWPSLRPSNPSVKISRQHTWAIFWSGSLDPTRSQQEAAVLIVQVSFLVISCSSHNSLLSPDHTPQSTTPVW